VTDRRWLDKCDRTWNAPALEIGSIARRVPLLAQSGWMRRTIALPSDGLSNNSQSVEPTGSFPFAQASSMTTNRV
jgi:hypothetical protein